MYLSAERLALVNKEIRENFARTSIAWQAIPHWDICDPGKTRVPNGDISSPLFVDVLPQQEPLQITVAQATAPTPDSLIAAATATTVALAAKVDRDVLPKLLKAKASVAITSTGPQDLQDALIEARALLEDAGYR